MTWPRLLFATLLLISPAAFAGDGGARIDEDASILAVVTHKAGLFAGKAHNHLVAARGDSARLELDPEDLTRSSFAIELDAAELVIDDPEMKARWHPELEAFGILDEPFNEMSEKDRGKVRETMLGRGQLHAEAYPRIAARVVAVEPGETEHGGQTFDHVATLALTVHETTVEKPVAVRCRLEDGVATVEAVGAYAFTDFGIEPYSAFLGAVKNRDTFHVFVHLEAELGEAEAGGGS